jgi:predicted nucleotidyltransferase
MSTTKPSPIETARLLFREKYSDALIIFLGGSAQKKETTTDSSDLDLVVVYEKLPHAYRESYIFRGWPVEVFIHDLETLKYFFLDDIRSENPATVVMVGESIEIPGPTPLSVSLKNAARIILEGGPPPLSVEEDERIRYIITTLVNDIRNPRSTHELIGAGTQLYERVSYYYFRQNRKWMSSGKLLSRKMYAMDAPFAEEFCAAFADLFKGNSEKVLRLVETLLEPSGGLIFANYRYDAPPHWRIPIKPDPPQPQQPSS